MCRPTLESVGISRFSVSHTGLTMDTAEELQVANYGLGGHYEPHFDYARVSHWEGRVVILVYNVKNK